MRGEREENRLMEYTITPLTPHTGAEVRGIDLNEGVDTETRAAPRQAARPGPRCWR
jgi:hypothetical protein